MSNKYTYIILFFLVVVSKKQFFLQLNQTFVIIIGVSEYPNLKDKKLDYSDNDAELILNYFLKKGDIPKNNISSFINEEANSRDEIGQEIRNKLLIESKPDDLVVIYFAGHGDVDNDVGKGYLLLNLVKPPSESSYKFNQTIALEDIREYMTLASNKGIKTLLFTDACRSGIIISDNINTKQTLTSLNNSWGNSAKLVSCLPNENSIEGSQWGNGHGVFTYFLVNGLKGLADKDNNGIVNYKELKYYVEENVVRETLEKQNPSASSSDPYMPISLVNIEQKKEAELELSNHLNLPTLNKKRGVGDYYENISPRLRSIIQLYENLITKEFFLDDEISKFDTNTISLKSPKFKYKLHNKMIGSIDKTFDGKYTAIGSHDNLIDILEFSGDTIKNKTQLSGHRGGVTSLCFSPSGKKLASGSWDNSIIIWDYKSGEKLKFIKSADKDDITALCFIDDNTLLSGSNNGNIKVWNLTDLTFKSLVGHTKKINDIIFNSDTIYSASDDGTINLCNINTNKVIKTLSAHRGKVKDISLLNFSNNLVSLGYDGKLKFWNTKNYNLVKEIKFDYKQQNCFDIDQSENYCFVGSKQYKINIVDLNSNKIIKDKILGKRGVPCFIYDPVNNILEIGDYGGNLTRQKFEINSKELSAYNLYKILINNKELHSLKHRISGSLLIGLNKYISSVVNPLVNGNLILPNLISVQRAIKYAEITLEIVSIDSKILYQRMTINKLLLEIYQILMSKSDNLYDEGLSKIEQIKKIDSNGAYVYSLLAKIYKELNELQKAKENASITEEKAPLWSEASCNSGKIFLHEKQYQEAEYKFLETIKKGPDQSKGYYNLGLLQLQLGDFEKAKINLEKAYSIDPDIDLIACANVELLYKTGRTKIAFDFLQKKLDNNTRSSKILSLDAKLKTINIKNKNDLNNIHINYMKILEMDSGYYTKSSLAFFYTKLRGIKNEKLLKTFVSSLISENSFGVSIKDYTDYQLKDHRKVLQKVSRDLFKSSIKLNKNYLDNYLGLWLNSISPLSDVKLKNFISSHDNSSECNYTIARYFQINQEYKKALKYYSRALKIDPGCLLGYLNSIQICKILKKTKSIKKLSKKINSAIKNCKALYYIDEILKFENSQ